MSNVADVMTWAGGAGLLLLLLAAGFLVSWVATDVAHLGRTPYVAVLAVVTAGATGVTAWWSGASAAELFTDDWPAGLLAGVVTGVVVALAIRKFPGTLSRAGRELHVAEAWEGVVYGVAEGLLLSGLPAFVAWQTTADAGWATPASWGAALVTSAAMIAVHHFGYWDYRSREVLPVIGGCLILTVGYLASGSLLAPALGHVMMHVSGITKGVELPPHPHRRALVH